jgi:hypothetical protein
MEWSPWRSLSLLNLVQETNFVVCNVSVRHHGIICCSKPDDAEECATSKSDTSGKVMRHVI